MRRRHTRRGARVALGAFLMLHGLAHALPAMRTVDAAAGWLTAADGQPLLFAIELLLWATASTGFLAAGMGLLGVRALRPRWSTFTFAAVLCSLALLLFELPRFAIPGAVIDIVLLIAIYPLGASWLLLPTVRHRTGAMLANVLAVALLAYTTTVILARPLIMSSGARTDEIRMRMLGDQKFEGRATYAVHHAITIAASPAEVWPWIAQIGQDKGGFYSHSILENLAGCRLRNADRLHAEWQHLRTGDTIWATPPDYLGTGKRFGWHVDLVVPERVLVLQNWGQFVLLPQADGTTRMVVRTRLKHRTKWQDIALAPVGVFVFEPAHYIMERQMLMGIKQRVEHQL